MISHLSRGTHTLVVSYLGVRRAIGAIGLLLPVVLGPVGWLVFGIPIQDNMSSYYHTALRDVFVGAMCAIGIFLFCYRGYDWIESWTAQLRVPLRPGGRPLPARRRTATRSSRGPSSATCTRSAAGSSS